MRKFDRDILVLWGKVRLGKATVLLRELDHFFLFLWNFVVVSSRFSISLLFGHSSVLIGLNGEREKDSKLTGDT